MKYTKFLILLSITTFSCLSLYNPIQQFYKASFNQNNPQLILVLGGDIDREEFGLKIAHYLNMPILISSGSNPEYGEWLVEKEGISSHLVKRDYKAKDTLSNFTSLVDDLSKKGIQHALLITSEDHIERAIAIGKIVAGSRGITLSSISVPCSSKCDQESRSKYYIDLVRAVIWVISGKDIKTIVPNVFKPDFIN